MTTIKQGTSLIAAAALLSLSAFLVISDRPAFAESRAEATADKFAFHFGYDAEELNSQNGANALLNRLERDVRRACRSDQRPALSERRAIDACVDATMAKTVSGFGSANLATAYENRTDG